MCCSREIIIEYFVVTPSRLSKQPQEIHLIVALIGIGELVAEMLEVLGEFVIG